MRDGYAVDAMMVVVVSSVPIRIRLDTRYRAWESLFVYVENTTRYGISRGLGYTYACGSILYFRYLAKSWEAICALTSAFSRLKHRHVAGGGRLDSPISAQPSTVQTWHMYNGLISYDRSGRARFSKGAELKLAMLL